MKYRTFNIRLIAALSVILLAQVIAGNHAAMAQESSTTWDKPQAVERKAKPKHVYRPRVKTVRVRPKVESAPLLTVQYRVLKLKPDGSQVETNALSSFHAGDLLRLGVTANQSGFLYVIHQDEGADGAILFPDSRVNDGQNYVEKNKEFALPSPNCGAPNPMMCWYKVSAATKQEYFIIIFSRDQIMDLPNQAAVSGGMVKKELIDQYIANVNKSDYVITNRPRNVKMSTPGGVYSYWVTNKNLKVNEDIILRVPLIKGM
jgi:hypothetical protein